jgi:hypothetical protein
MMRSVPHFPSRSDALALDWAAAEGAHGLARGRASSFAPNELSLTQAVLHALLSRHQPQVVACWDEQFLSHSPSWSAPAHVPFPFDPTSAIVMGGFDRQALHVLSQHEESRLGADWLVVLVEPSGRQWRAILVQAKVMKATTKTRLPLYDALNVSQTTTLIAAEKQARAKGWPLYAMYAFYNFMPWDCPDHDAKATYGYQTACTLSRPAASFGVTLVPARDLNRLTKASGGEYDAKAKRAAGESARPFSCLLECHCLQSSGLSAVDGLAREGIEIPPPELGGRSAPLPEEFELVLLGEGNTFDLERVLREALTDPEEGAALPPNVAGVLVAELTSGLA